MVKHRWFRATVACGTLAFGLAQAWAIQTKEPTPPNTAQPAANGAALFQQLLDSVKAAAGNNDMQSLPQPPKSMAPRLPGSDLSGEARDPFSTTPTIETEASKRGGESPVNSPLTVPVKFPVMSLRGFASNGSQPPVAILEITGSGMFFVRTGDKINLPPAGGSMELTIQEVQGQGEYVKVRSQGETTEVRDPDRPMALSAPPATPPARTRPEDIQY